MNTTRERFYRTPDGRLIFSAIKSVGVDHAVSFAPMYGWSKNGFPQECPTTLGEETIIGAILATRAKSAA